MNILITLTILCYSIGVFFSTAMLNIGYIGFFFVACLFFREKDFRQCFKQFHQTHHLWWLIGFLLGLLLLFLPKGDWNISKKYLFMVFFLLWPPLFYYRIDIWHRLKHVFALVAFAYMLWYWKTAFYHFITEKSVLVSFLILYEIACVIFEKNYSVSLFRFCFYFWYLFGIQREKTGPFALICALICALKGRKRVFFCFCIKKVCLLGSLMGILGIGCILKPSPLWLRLQKVQKTSSVVERKEALVEACERIKEHHYNPCLGTRGIHTTRLVHYHNAWIITWLQWGLLGLAFLIAWFGYFFTYFFKNMYRSNSKIKLYCFWGLTVNICTIFAGCCDHFFHSLLCQSTYLFIMSGCIAMIELHKKKVS